MHHVAVPDHVILAFNAHLACGTHRRFGLVGHEIIVADNLCAYETLLEIGVDDSCRLRGLVALVYGPGTALVCPRGEEGL